LEQKETNSSLSLERLVDVEKAATQSILYGLLFFEERMSQNLEVHLEKIKKNALDDITNTINRALENVNVNIIHFYHIFNKERQVYGLYKKYLIL